ncbi:uncharacterized protein PV07_05209 [Cladophialophora immunda]|uniref:Uncharacterized protein n=1 Tax=Cladophialophora immunda TaxID=569365 RepID=A0A0D1ZN63_9EURO|nr:uncharacterized protein PV07_05209 [Cladophialophora immunda]KIW29391.1 hypothetical protein PV07_05209 [Cladophialophora immunda]
MATAVTDVAEGFSRLTLSPSAPIICPSGPGAGNSKESSEGLTLSQHPTPDLLGDWRRNPSTFFSATDPVVFARVLAICRKWKIPERAARNMAALAAGRKGLPVILLQNPNKGHDKMDFAAMAKSCATIRWIKNVLLRGLGLSIDDVIILDVCLLLDDQWLTRTEGRNPKEADQAVEEVFALLEELLEVINPSMMICCQCATGGRNWITNPRGRRLPKEILASNATEIAEMLSSRTALAKVGESQQLPGKRWKNARIVRAFHPMWFAREQDVKVRSQREQLLTDIIEVAFVPYCMDFVLDRNRMLMDEWTSDLMKMAEKARSIESNIKRLEEEVEKLKRQCMFTV